MDYALRKYIIFAFFLGLSCALICFFSAFIRFAYVYTFFFLNYILFRCLSVMVFTILNIVFLLTFLFD